MFYTRCVNLLLLLIYKCEWHAPITSTAHHALQYNTHVNLWTAWAKMPLVVLTAVEAWVLYSDCAMSPRFTTCSGTLAKLLQHHMSAGDLVL